MLEIQRKDSKWTQFHAIKTLIPCEELFDKRPLAELEDKVYGKYAGGVAGYNVWWIYETVDKKQLREHTAKQSTFSYR
jgi:hypothetical protein